jgi:hypothetical protein
VGGEILDQAGPDHDVDEEAASPGAISTGGRNDELGELF